MSDLNADTDDERPAPAGKALSDDDLLRYVRNERRRSIGFGEGDGGELVSARERALRYAKGDVTQDISNVDKRSQAVSTDVADAVETVLPDLIEIFIGGDDVATFTAQNEQDETQAQEETDFVNHVVFVENEGFLNFYTAFKDALLCRTGIFHWWWEEASRDEQLARLPAEAAQLAPAVQAIAEQQHAEQQGGGEIASETQDDGSVSITLSALRGRVCFRAVPSEDFTVSQDTVSLRDSVYCAMRSRERVQALIERGLDPDKVRELPPYNKPNVTMDRARDDAGEHDAGNDASGEGDLRLVEVRTHFLRIDADGDGETELWQIQTDSEEQVLLKKEQIPRLPFGAITPYINAHRFYGESLADKLLEVQRIKTTLLRMLLDSGYFALNQRAEVALERANEFTIADLLRNEPNMPVRSQTGDAVRPLQAGQLTFDVESALEYVSVMGELRTGVVRNAQGLNPDSLHQTAQGAMTLMTAAQKRVRMIARIFSETGVKDLFLGIHAMLRDMASPNHQPYSAKLAKGGWKQVRPENWPQRDAMTVHVGVGSAGREHDMIVANNAVALMEKVVQLQQGTQGPFVSEGNVRNLLMSWSRAAGQKNPEQYWSDPNSPQMQQAMAQKAQQQAQQPNPAMAEVQGKLQIAQAEMQAKQQQSQQQMQLDAQLRQQQAQSDAQLEQARASADVQADERKAQREHELAVMKHQGDMELARTKIAGELQLKREQIAAELQMKRQLGEMQAHSQHQIGMAKAEAQAENQVHPGGEPG